LQNFAAVFGICVDLGVSTGAGGYTRSPDVAC
jgi:hypothetical protein